MAGRLPAVIGSTDINNVYQRITDWNPLAVEESTLDHVLVELIIDYCITDCVNKLINFLYLRLLLRCEYILDGNLSVCDTAFSYYCVQYLYKYFYKYLYMYFA